MDTPLDEIEKSTWTYILNEFPLEVLSIMGNFIILANCISSLVHTQPILEKSGFVDKLLEADKEEKCLGVWTLLLQETLQRLYSARLLLFTGHQSRCLSCVRDAFECLRWADICLKDVYQADCWLRGKDVTAQRSHVYPDLICDEVNSKIQSVLNPEGTHAYLRACLISIQSIHVEVTPVFKALIQRSIVSMISVIDTSIAYTLNARPDLREIVKIDPMMPMSLKVCYDNNLKSLKDGGYL